MFHRVVESFLRYTEKRLFGNQRDGGFVRQRRVDDDLMARSRGSDLLFERSDQALGFQRLGPQFEDKCAHLTQTGFSQRQHVVKRLYHFLGVPFGQRARGLGAEGDTKERLRHRIVKFASKSLALFQHGNFLSPLVQSSVLDRNSSLISNGKSQCGMALREVTAIAMRERNETDDLIAQDQGDTEPGGNVAQTGFERIPQDLPESLRFTARTVNIVNKKGFSLAEDLPEQEVRTERNNISHDLVRRHRPAVSNGGGKAILPFNNGYFVISGDNLDLIQNELEKGLQLESTGDTVRYLEQR